MGTNVYSFTPFSILLICKPKFIGKLSPKFRSGSLLCQQNITSTKLNTSYQQELQVVNRKKTGLISAEPISSDLHVCLQFINGII